MLLSVRELEVRKVDFDVVVPPGKLCLPGTRFRQLEAMRIGGVAELVHASEEIRVHGHIRGVLERECDRCLELVPFEIDRDFDLHYQPMSFCPVSTEMRIEDDDSTVGYYEGDGIHLAEVLREQILLWLPMRWLCDENCKGLCPVCGQNRNRVPCNCHEEAGDDRWAALRGYQAPIAR